MPAIYGTPVIFIKKPDTSEQWLLNSTVNPAYFGEDKRFYIEFISNNTSYGRFHLNQYFNSISYNSTSVCSGGIMQETYRQITLEKPATGELLTWLEANAVRLLLTGTQVFNETVNVTNIEPGPGKSEYNIPFTSNGSNYEKLELQVY